MKNVTTIVHHYLHCALWTAELDNFNLEDIHANAVTQALADCTKFVDKAGDLLNELTEEQIGHDFWLSRNGHGAGFFDRDLGEIGDKLQELARKFGEKNAFPPEFAGNKIIIE